MQITFATCWYPLSCKFPVDTYLNWMSHFLSEINNFYLVLYTDEAGEAQIRNYFAHAATLAPATLANPNLKIIQKHCEEWYNYKHKAQWEKNHKKNTLLNTRTEWKVNMLWAEKVHFVNDARQNPYFPLTQFYGWCDIGYFRSGPCPNFAGPSLLQSLNKNKIYYAAVNPLFFQELQPYVLNKNEHGLPVVPIPADQVSIAGGFFMAHHSKIESWKTIFANKLALYFQHDYLVKDDQIIIVDCILNEPKRFEIVCDPDTSPYRENPWFYFRRGVPPRTPP